MKKILIAGVLPLLLATGCQNGRVETSKDEAISFEVALGKQTASRAAEKTAWENGDVINVKAYDGSTWVQDFTLNYDGSWTATPSMTQPGYSLDYYAWTPSTEGTFAYSGAATLGYTVAATAATQLDLLGAKISTANAVVTLAFNHILSQINFAILGPVGVKVGISDIKVNGVKSNGDYAFTAGTWSDQTTPTTANYDYVVASTAATDGTDAVVLLNGSTTSNALMLIPQTFDAASTATITFAYTLTSINDVSLGSGTGSVNLRDFSATTWTPGKRYLYLIDFTDILDGDVITFDVILNPWADADNYNVATTVEVVSANKAAIEGAIATHNAAKGTTSALTVFPISLPAATALTTDITLDFTLATDNFVTGDQIRIQCYNTTNAGHILSSVSGWTLDNTTAVVTLTKD